MIVLSPDSGGLERCRLFRDALQQRLEMEIDVFYLDEAGGGRISGDIEGKQIIICDDMIATGRTIELCDKTVQVLGGEIWAVCATHFIGGAERLQNIQRLIVTDTIPCLKDKGNWNGKLYVVSTTRMFAEAIRCTYYGDSISQLLN